MFSELYLTKIALQKQLPAGSYLADLPALRHLASVQELPLTRRVTFLVGENGTGKSTLLEAVALAMGFNPEGGSINFRFSTNDSHSQLFSLLTVGKGIRRPKTGFFLRAESFYNVASYLDTLQREDSGTLAAYGGISLHEQSHGESVLSLVRHRFGPNGLYLLDEPEAALSPMRQLALLSRIRELTEQNCQFVICTHSPILMALPGAEVFELSEKGIQSVPFHQTEHFQLTSLFLQNPERFLRILFEDPSPPSP